MRTCVDRDLPREPKIVILSLMSKISRILQGYGVFLYPAISCEPKLDMFKPQNRFIHSDYNEY